MRPPLNLKLGSGWVFSKVLLLVYPRKLSSHLFISQRTPHKLLWTVCF